MLRLNTIRPARGSKTGPKRLGRGPGSGLGQTAGKGDKGQLARTGGKVRPGFEGGQTPLYRRLPKRGFTNFGSRDEAILNLSDLQVIVQGDIKEISPEGLKELGLLRRKVDRLVILSMGELSQAVSVKAHRVSESARKKIEQAGGSVSLIPIPAAAAHSKRRR